MDSTVSDTDHPLLSPVVDATRYHRPDELSTYVQAATLVAGNKRALSKRLGVSPSTLSERPDNRMRYLTQVGLEQIIREGVNKEREALAAQEKAQQLIDKAMSIAKVAYAASGIRGDANHPDPLDHPAKVALHMEDTPTRDPEVIAAAWLHDILKVTPLTVDDLTEQMPVAVVNLVMAITLADSHSPNDDPAASPLAGSAAAQNLRVAELLDNCHACLRSAQPAYAIRHTMDSMRREIRSLELAHKPLARQALATIQIGLASAKTV